MVLFHLRVHNGTSIVPAVTNLPATLRNHLQSVGVEILRDEDNNKVDIVYTKEYTAEEQAHNNAANFHCGYSVLSFFTAFPSFQVEQRSLEEFDAFLDDETKLLLRSRSSKLKLKPTPQLYPPTVPETMYQPGVIVTVLKSGKVFARGQIEDKMAKTKTTNATETKNNNDDEDQFKGRLRVRFLNDSSRAHIKPSMLVPYPTSTHQRTFYVAPTTDLYRRFAKTVGTMEDIFIEVGSDFGQTTSIVQERGFPYVVGIDKSTSHVEEAKVRYNKCLFVAADVLTHSHCLKECISKFNVNVSSRRVIVFIDINGNRPLDAVQECVRVVEREVQPWIMIVKSKELYKHLGGNHTTLTKKRKNR